MAILEIDSIELAHGDECAVVFSTHNAAVVDSLGARCLMLDGEPNLAFKPA